MFISSSGCEKNTNVLRLVKRNVNVSICGQFYGFSNNPKRNNCTTQRIEQLHTVKNIWTYVLLLWQNNGYNNIYYSRITEIGTDFKQKRISPRV